MSWGSLAPILTALDSPKPLPGCPLDSLGVPDDPPRPPGPPRDFDLNRFWFPRDLIWTGFDKNSALVYTGALSSLHHSARAYTGAIFSKKLSLAPTRERYQACTIVLAPTRERYFPKNYRSRLHGSAIKLAP